MRWFCFTFIAAAALAVQPIHIAAQQPMPTAGPNPPNLDSTNNPSMGQALSMSSEICVDDIIDIMTYQGIRQPLVKSEISAFPAPNGEVVWYCGNEERLTLCPVKTNFVVVEWASPYAFTFVCRHR